MGVSHNSFVCHWLEGAMIVIWAEVVVCKLENGVLIGNVGFMLFE